MGKQQKSHNEEFTVAHAFLLVAPFPDYTRKLPIVVYNTSTTFEYVCASSRHHKKKTKAEVKKGSAKGEAFAPKCTQVQRACATGSAKGSDTLCTIPM